MEQLLLGLDYWNLTSKGSKNDHLGIFFDFKALFGWYRLQRGWWTIETSCGGQTLTTGGVGIIRKGIIRKVLELSGKRWNYPEKNLPVQNMGIIRKKSCFVEKSQNSTKTSFRLELYGVKNGSLSWNKSKLVIRKFLGSNSQAKTILEPVIDQIFIHRKEFIIWKYEMK